MDILESYPDDDVYTGVWINRSFGRVYGATLTLDRRVGGFLIAFLALYVGATGRSFWKIARYLVYHAVASDTVSDGVYHQRQAILRNSALPNEAAYAFMSVAFAWRNKTKDVVKRLLPVASLAAIISIVFVLAGIFSSKVTSTINEVLLSGKLCGNMTAQAAGLNFTFDGSLTPGVTTYRTKRVHEYLTYALECYGGNNTEKKQQSDKCQTFPLPALPYTKNTSAECPFPDKNVCRLKDDNIVLDTGFYNTYKHFGLNAGPPVDVRLRRHCAPLATEGFSTRYTDPLNPDIQLARYYYGPSRPPANASSASNDTTYTQQVRFNLSAANLLPGSVPTYISADYRTFITSAAPSQPLFAEGSPLRRNDAFITLIFLDSTNILNVHKTEDPWFSATTPLQIPEAAQSVFGIIKELYTADEPTGVLGCATQITYCNPVKPGPSNCADNFATEDFIKGFMELWPDAGERAQVLAFASAMNTFRVFSPDGYYDQNSIPSLLTRYSLYQNCIQPIAVPNNRWKDEVEYIFQANLAALQSRFVEHARAEFDILHESLCTKEVECDRICKSQKIKSGEHYSFKLVGVFIIIFGGGFVVVLGTFIEVIASLIARFKHKITYAHLEWKIMSTLQLQRQAHERHDLGDWTNATDAVPVTKRGEGLGILDISDNLRHPRFVRVDTFGGETTPMTPGYDGKARMKDAGSASMLVSNDAGFEMAYMTSPNTSGYGGDDKTRYNRVPDGN